MKLRPTPAVPGTRFLALLTLLLACACFPLPLAGQTCSSETDPACDQTGPTVQISPGSGTVSSSPLSVTIDWEDDRQLVSSTIEIRLNGVDVTSSFTHSGSGMSMQSTGSVSLVSGQQNVLQAWISDWAGNRSGASATYAYNVSTPPDDTVPPPPPHDSVVVSPDGYLGEVVAAGRRAHGFLVRNAGNRRATYQVQAPACSVFTSCLATASSVTLDPNGWTSVGVTFQPGTLLAQTGSIRLTVVQTDPLAPAGAAVAQDTGKVILTTVTALDTLMLSEASTEPVIERGLCLTIAAGPGAAYECGDLRLAHALPGTVTLNKARAPVLLYNSQHAHPYPVVAARVTIPSGMSATSVEVSLTLSGESSPRVVKSFSTTGWTAGTARRLAVGFDALSGAGIATNVYDYTLTATAITSSGPVQLFTRPGKLAVVNRATNNPYGAGWWLAGLEQIVVRPDGSRLWVGGDGSLRLYQPVAGEANKWVATPVSRPDTLYRDASGPTAGQYYRLLPGRAQVRFNTTGQHIATVNRLGHRTSFVYNGAGVRLDTLVLPQGSGGGTPQRYSFHYAGGALLDSVYAPGGRVVSLRRGGDTLIIHEPSEPTDTLEVRYRSDPSFANRITHRTDRMGRITQYQYSAGSKLVSVRRWGGGPVGKKGTASDASDVVLGFSPAEDWGLASPAAATQPYTLFDGPRPNADAEDKYIFWLNRWGAPAIIRDAQQIQTGGTKDTRLYREDPRFPALVTRTVAPNGREVSASYDERGNVVTSTDWSTQSADGRYTTTLYTWDAKWDAPTSITLPEGEVTLMAYDTATGQKLWEQAGTSPARRVTYTYYPQNHTTAPGLVQSVQAPLTNPETYTYDTRGNLKSVAAPDGAVTHYLRDAIGRDTLAKTPGATQADTVRSYTTYNAAGLVSKTRQVGTAVPIPLAYGMHYPLMSSEAPPEEVEVENTYDREGRSLSVSRRAIPDPAGIGKVTTRWEYDVFGRQVREIAPDSTPEILTDNPADVTVYDPAGNAIQVITRRGDTIRTAYDAMNRVKWRVVPSVTAAPDTLRSVFTSSSDVDASRVDWNFPLRTRAPDGTLSVSNHPDSTSTPGGLTILKDSASFTYDEVGNLLRAANNDAITTRTYNTNGTLASETQRIRTYVGQDTTTHAYTLTYTYDRNGRRTTLGHPAALAPAGGSTTFYRYDPETGALAEVQHGAQLYRFTYDAAGRPDSTIYPFVLERRRYDAAGHLAHQERWRNSTLIQQDSFKYDLRGKVESAHLLTDTVFNTYSGLGSLIRSYTNVNTLADNDPEEVYTVDALGNTIITSRLWKEGKQDITAPRPEVTQQLYRPGTGRSGGTAYLAGSSAGRSDAVVFDLSGNRIITKSRYYESGYGGLRPDNSPSELGRVWMADMTRAYYGADQKLRVLDRRTCAWARAAGAHIVWPFTSPSSNRLNCWPPYYGSRPAFEEYRYDALGRRILTVTDQSWACWLNCVDGATRTIWDGDQILYEIRAPRAAIEADGDTLPEVVDRTQYGRVGYVHGPGLDQPLAVVRMSFHPKLMLPEIILPHLNWRGAYESGTFLSTGGPKGRCIAEPTHEPADWEGIYVPSPSNPDDVQTSPGPDSVYVCVEVSWPAQSQWMTHLERPLERGANGPRNWMGSLIEGGKDVSGQMYRRNRYYDPSSGKFTQEDPIGLAGGLNVYGFASGDPVNYSDPYGLCPQSMQNDPAKCQARDQKQADRVARDALNTVNPTSVASDTEYGGLIYEMPDGTFGATPAVVGTPCTGGPCGVNPQQAQSHVPAGATVRGDYHTHGAFNPNQPGISYEYFSRGDWSGINSDGASSASYLGGYLGTPSGRAYFYRANSLAQYGPAGMQAIQRLIGTIAN